MSSTIIIVSVKTSCKSIGSGRDIFIQFNKIASNIVILQPVLLTNEQIIRGFQWLMVNYKGVGRACKGFANP
jgi:hypothetical protein